MQMGDSDQCPGRNFRLRHKYFARDWSLSPICLAQKEPQDARSGHARQRGHQRGRPTAAQFAVHVSDLIDKDKAYRRRARTTVAQEQVA